MLLNMRDNSVPIPASVVPTWVAEDDVATRVNILFATLIVYDTGEYIPYACFVTELSITWQSSHLTKRYLDRIDCLLKLLSDYFEIKYFWVSIWIASFLQSGRSLAVSKEEAGNLESSCVLLGEEAYLS